MYNTNGSVGGAPLLTVESAAIAAGCGTTPRTPEILNSLIAMTNPMEYSYAGGGQANMQVRIIQILYFNHLSLVTSPSQPSDCMHYIISVVQNPRSMAWPIYNVWWRPLWPHSSWTRLLETTSANPSITIKCCAKDTSKALINVTSTLDISSDWVMSWVLPVLIYGHFKPYCDANDRLLAFSCITSTLRT